MFGDGDENDAGDARFLGGAAAHGPRGEGRALR